MESWPGLVVFANPGFYLANLASSGGRRFVGSSAPSPLALPRWRIIAFRPAAMACTDRVAPMIVRCGYSVAFWLEVAVAVAVLRAWAARSAPLEQLREWIRFESKPS